MPRQDEPWPALPQRTQKTLRIEIPRSPTSDFATHDSSGCTNARLATEITQRWPQLECCPRLEEVAEVFAQATVKTGTTELPQAFLEHLVHWAGRPEVNALAVTISTSEDRANDALDQLGEVVAVSPPGLSHVGMARVPLHVPPFRWRWCFVVVRDRLSLSSPVPRRAAPGSTIEVHFQLPSDLESPWLVLLNAPFSEERSGSAERTDGGWCGEARLPDAPGISWIQVMATGELGPEVIATLPIDSRPEPAAETTWQGTTSPDESWVASPEEAERLLISLVNQDRRRFGLPSLEADSALTSIARQHSLDMRETGFLGHVSPHRGAFVARLADAGYATRAARENVARAPSLEETHRALMTSPPHRGNILSPEVSRIGVGIVADRRPNAPPHLITTEIFAEPLAAPATVELRSQLLERANRARAKAGQRPLQASQALSEVASKLADAPGQPLPPAFELDAMVHQALDAAAEDSHEATQVRCERLVVSGGSELDLPESVLSESARSLGLAVSRSRLSAGGYQYTVVFVITDR
jgi:uncharacterized protein YkwD